MVNVAYAVNNIAIRALLCRTVK